MPGLSFVAVERGNPTALQIVGINGYDDCHPTACQQRTTKRLTAVARSSATDRFAGERTPRNCVKWLDWPELSDTACVERMKQTGLVGPNRNSQSAVRS